MKYEINLNNKAEGYGKTNSYDSISIESGNISMSIEIGARIIRDLNEELEHLKSLGHKIDLVVVNNMKFACRNILYARLQHYNKECFRCKKIKLLKHFYFQKQDNVFNSYCKVCCGEISKEWNEKNETRVLKWTEKKTYIMKDKTNNLYKIGSSKNPKVREKTLQSEKPSIILVKIWDKNIETRLHNLYSEFRIRGEWFKLSKIQLHYICTKY
jgi:hypothetical protein